MDLRDFSQKYLNFLSTELKGLNLTAIKDEEEFYLKQIIDSVNPYEQSDKFRNSIQEKKVAVDIGFGGGFPIIPLAYCLPDIKFIGIESKRKKVDAVTKIAQHFNLNNVQLIHSRFEEILFDKEVVIVSKAVATVEKLMSRIEYSEDIQAFFYKGPNLFDLEEKGLNNISDEWEIFENVSIKVPNTHDRILIGLKNKNVPRGTSKKLVNISKYL